MDKMAENIRAEIVSQAADAGLALISFDEETIIAEAICYHCLGSFAVSVQWDCPYEDDPAAAISVEIGNALDNLSGEIQHVLCEDCADEEARQYERQVASDYYYDRI